MMIGKKRVLFFLSIISVYGTPFESLDFQGRAETHNEQNLEDLLLPKFYLVQYGLEKLDFLLHKEMSNLLYTRYKKKDVFALAGFNNLQQGHRQEHLGYQIKDYYQWVGGIGDVKSFSILGSLGVTESKLHTHPQKAHASYDTLWANLGLKKTSSKLQLGCDIQAAYSFISSSNDIDALSLKMKAHHRAYLGSIEAKGTYRVLDDKTSLEPYDAISLFYSHEGSYTEKGGKDLSVKVDDEDLFVIRNELGFYLNIPCTKSVDLFIDPSWMYEYKINKKDFKAVFQNKDIVESFSQSILPKNYGRLNVGFYVKGRRLDFAITYIGLWAEKFSSAATSLKLELRF